MINGIEQHCEWIRDAIKKADSEGIKAIDATKEAETEWVDKVNHFGDVTIFSSKYRWLGKPFDSLITPTD